MTRDGCRAWCSLWSGVVCLYVSVCLWCACVWFHVWCPVWSCPGAGYGSVSGLAAGRSDLKEGDRDPVTGRLILDPLKIPTKDQGAPGTWEEYLKMRKEKEGGTARDVMVSFSSLCLSCA